MNPNRVSSVLPPNVCLYQLKRQAKDALKAHRAKDGEVCALLRHLRRFQAASDQAILGSELALNEAQYALAMHYGFTSWNALKQHIDAVLAQTHAHPIRTLPDGGCAIQGFESLAWGDSPQRRANSTIEAYAAILRAMGQDMPYERLMGLSGQAFRIQIWQKEFCPSAACAGPGFNTHETSERAAGCRVDWREVEHAQTPPDMAGLRRAIVESIDQGIPALYINEETSLIVGYQEAGQTLILRDYFNCHIVGSGYTRAQKPAWSIGIVRPKPVPPDYRKTVMESLQIALRLAYTESFNGYDSGFNAWETWRQRLRQGFPEGDCRDFGTILGNWYPYASLVNARHAAGVYLSDIARMFAEEPQQHLRSAASAFDQLQQMLHSRFDVVPAPWTVNGENPWSQTQRDAQAAVMEKALEFERQAFSDIQAAVESSVGILGPT